MSTLNTYNLKSPDSANTNLALDASGNVAIQAGSASAPSIYVTGDANTGIYSPGADQVAISTNGTGRLFIDSSGRLGLGTSSPSNILHVSGTAGTPAVFERTSTTGTFIALKDSASQTFIGNTNGVFSIQTPGSSYSDKLVVTSAGLVGIGTTSSPAASSVVLTLYGANSGGLELVSSNNSGGGTLVPSPNGGLQFYTQSGAIGSETYSERARIDSSGRLLVGTSSSLESNSLFQVYKSTGNSNIYLDVDTLSNTEAASYWVRGGSPDRNAILGVFKHSGITNPGPFLRIDEEDGGVGIYWTDNSGNLRVSGNYDHIGTTSGTVVGTQTSDERLKNIIGPVEYGLDTIKQINPVRYAFKSEPETEKIGFIAQQVLPLVPQSVFDTDEHIEGEPEDAPTKLGMEYVALIPVLVNAIKELSAEVDALKAQLQAS
jgi:hypothetical protein